MNRLVYLAIAIAIIFSPTFAQAVAYRFDLDFNTGLPDGNVPVSPNIDFAQMIQNAGVSGVLDPNSISVINKATWQSIPFARTEDFAYGDHGRLEWAIKDPAHTQYEVRFRTTDTRPALIPQDYTPLVGTGDLLRWKSLKRGPTDSDQPIPGNLTVFDSAGSNPTSAVRS